MDLQNKLLSLEKYNIGFKVYNGKFVININYPKGWNVLKPSNNDIQYYIDNNDDGIYYYISPIEVGIDDVFNEIDNTISYNTELENKVILFKEKMNELQNLFLNTNLDTLKTLEFKMKVKKRKGKKNSTNVNDTDITFNKTDNESDNQNVENNNEYQPNKETKIEGLDYDNID